MNVKKVIFPGLFIAVVSMLWTVHNLSSGYGAPGSLAAAELKLVGLADPALPLDGQCSIRASYPPGVQQWCGLIETYAQVNRLDMNLVSAVILRESSGKPDAYSKSGAVGLMQVMPSDGLAARFQCRAGPCFADRPTMRELFDPEFNVAYGCRMLADLISKRGSVREALKAYGPMDVGYTYADLVLATLQQYK